MTLHYNTTSKRPLVVTPYLQVSVLCAPDAAEKEEALSALRSALNDGEHSTGASPHSTKTALNSTGTASSSTLIAPQSTGTSPRLSTMLLQGLFRPTAPDTVTQTPLLYNIGVLYNIEAVTLTLKALLYNTRTITV
jgi:hypothetical protein